MTITHTVNKPSFALLSLSLLLVACENESQAKKRWTDGSLPTHIPVKPRWYTDQQVSRGAEVYGEFCAECHQEKAQGEKNWGSRGSDGKFPAPPLNGTGHTPRHLKKDLQDVILYGSKKEGGSMQGFKNELTRQQVDEVIAWMQSMWSNANYQKWSALKK